VFASIMIHFVYSVFKIIYCVHSFMFLIVYASMVVSSICVFICIPNRTLNILILSIP
jgi:hypothetical protein